MSYPSRTIWGASHSLAEKYPFLFETRFFIKAYNYWWGYTSAQIDLMLIDTPMVVYRKQKRDGKYSQKDMEEAVQRWKDSRKNGSLVGKKLTLNDILNGNEN